MSKKIKVTTMTQEESDRSRMSDEEYDAFVEHECKVMDLANGAEIRAWRKRMGWTQKQLANELDIAQPHLSRWERGVWSPPGCIL